MDTPFLLSWMFYTHNPHYYAAFINLISLPTPASIQMDLKSHFPRGVELFFDNRRHTRLGVAFPSFDIPEEH